jgi:hypothetical protein
MFLKVVVNIILTAGEGISIDSFANVKFNTCSVNTVKTGYNEPLYSEHWI